MPTFLILAEKLGNLFMRNYYLLIPRIQVQAGNAMSAYWVANGAPVTAAVAFAHALGRQCDFVEALEGVGLIHHHTELQGDHESSNMALHQRRGATFIDQADYVAGTLSLGLQPTATRHMVISLVICVNEDALIDDVIIADFLASARFSGGQIIDHGKVVLLESEHALNTRIPNGFWVMDRRDLLDEGTDPTETLLHILDNKSDFYSASLQQLIKQHTECETLDADQLKLANNKIDEIKKNPRNGLKALKIARTYLNQTTCENLHNALTDYLNENSWLSATCLGYSCISPIENRGNVRGNYPHAFVEPLVGMTQYKSTRTPTHSLRQSVFWREQWLNETTYVIQQSL